MTSRPLEAAVEAHDLPVLGAISERLLWLSTAIVDRANRRPSVDGLKVGGHQASSASMVDIMTTLWFAELRAEDLVSVKPHAAPVLHAVNYLLGWLEPGYLDALRTKGGLQSYPSRTKDPGRVDFSTGSVGIGATASIWAALARRYLTARKAPHGSSGRFFALLGDAELDEGAVWEAVLEPAAADLGELVWIVDLNRQSLDRVVPDMRVRQLVGMFAAAGWQTLTVKWGSRIQQLFEQPGGEALEVRLDTMSNEEYQRILRAPADEVPLRLRAGWEDDRALAQAIAAVPASDWPSMLRDLGGHDHASLLEAYGQIDDSRPTVIFAYTVKGHGLPLAGHPGNHSALLTAEQMAELAARCGTSQDDPWAPFATSSAGAQMCRRRARALERRAHPPAPAPTFPASLGRVYTATTSTQAGFGRILLDIRRATPEAASRIVTCSPDVASSTNLGGWINKVGVFNPRSRADWFADDTGRLVRWTERPTGQHIELGIAEMNLVGLAAELGATWSRWAEPLIPVATIYDPFVSRALEPWSFGIYAGGQSIIVGTPSGVSLAPEGGAHQSISTPSVGLEQPGCTAWEPAFVQDLEWCLLDAMNHVGRPSGHSSYFRLSSRPIDQGLADVPVQADLRERRRRQAVAGGYRLHAPAEERITLVATGAIMPEVLAARDCLDELGIAAGVVCLTSPDLVFRATGGEGPRAELLHELFPPSHPVPMVTVHDGHPHTLAFLPGIRGVRSRSLGVSSFGQSSTIPDAYQLHGIDTASIVDAAVGLTGR